MTETKYSGKDVNTFLGIPDDDHVQYLKDLDGEDRIHETDNTLFSPSPHQKENNVAHEETTLLSAEYKRRNKENALYTKLIFLVAFLITAVLFAFNLDNPILAILLVVVIVSFIFYGWFFGRIKKYRDAKVEKMEETAEQQVNSNLNEAVKRWGLRNGFWDASNEELIWDEYAKFNIADDLLVAWIPVDDDGWFQLVHAADKTPLKLEDFPAKKEPKQTLSSDVTAAPINLP